MPSTNNIMGKCILFCESPITCISSDSAGSEFFGEEFYDFFPCCVRLLLLFEIILAGSANTL